jgi:N-acetylneuraminic acid mutarotase/MFS family permease
VAATSAEDEHVNWERLPDVPDRVGFAGPFAGVSADTLLVAGGANFPQDPPWRGGSKAWYDTVFALEQPHGQWRTVGKLPRPLAYGIAVTTQEGVLCIGGGDAQLHYADCFRLRWVNGELQTDALPPLPRPCAFGSGAVLGDTLFVAGGIDTPGATTALHNFWSLDLSRTDAHWEEREPWPGPERILPVAAACDGAFYMVSGARLKPGTEGKVARDYLTDAYRYRPGEGWTKLPDLASAVVAAPSPAPVVGGTKFLIIGGDDGTNVHFPVPDEHPGFSHQILAYDTIADRWENYGTTPFASCTVPQVPWRGWIVIPGGEIRPGIRTAEVWAGSALPAAIPYGWLDAFTLIGGVLALFTLVRPGVRGREGPATSAVGAWLVVGLLWVTAMLNYVDRQVVFSVFPLLQGEFHLSGVQLGFLATVFLWVYGILSPMAGFLADRFGCKPVIVGSLLIWSLVTWGTGRATSFDGLLWARGLMGLSEACYLPAALALIASVHSGRTRSRAIGLHQSGLYVGSILGGFGGGWIGEHYGWRWAFLLLGAVGVVYAVVLSFGLREETGEIRADSPVTAKPRLLTSLRELAALPGFWGMVLAFSAVGIANWVLYAWLPLHLHDTFHMGLGRAGFVASFYLQVASFAGILLGGWLADRWAATQPRGRQWSQALGLAVAAPAVACVGTTGSEVLLIAGLILFGLGKGFYDCNAMPVLCQVARPELRATGYGVFNLAGCLAGGAIAVVAGWCKDHGGIAVVFQGGGVLLMVATVCLWRLPLPASRPMATERPRTPDLLSSEQTRPDSGATISVPK